MCQGSLLKIPSRVTNFILGKIIFKFHWVIFHHVIPLYWRHKHRTVQTWTGKPVHQQAIHSINHSLLTRGHLGESKTDRGKKTKDKDVKLLVLYCTHTTCCKRGYLDEYFHPSSNIKCFSQDLINELRHVITL